MGLPLSPLRNESFRYGILNFDRVSSECFRGTPTTASSAWCGTSIESRLIIFHEMYRDDCAKKSDDFDFRICPGFAVLTRGVNSYRSRRVCIRERTCLIRCKQKKKRPPFESEGRPLEMMIRLLSEEVA
ncbi:hypothetical protein CGZ80_09425 [Rhodopirellula sp. MGV]|nr:hypothetical protein CGZ80_09425 [Rhodopirellula sp. MGV]